MRSDNQKARSRAVEAIATPAAAAKVFIAPVNSTVKLMAVPSLM